MEQSMPLDRADRNPKIQRPTQQQWFLRLQELNLNPKRNGQTINSACPNCGGKDRFFVNRDGLFGCNQNCVQKKQQFRVYLESANFWQKYSTPVQSKPNGQHHDAPDPNDPRFAERPDPDHVWEYQSRDGKKFEVFRIDAKPGIDKQMWQTSDVTLDEGDQWLPYISGGTFIQGKPVLVVEGEKTADAVKAVLGGEWNVLTYQRGAQNTDWSMLNGHDIFLWPDNDRVGFDKLQTLADAIRPVAGDKIKIVQAGGKWKDDAADFIDRGEPIAPLLERAWPFDDMALKPIVTIAKHGLKKCLNFMDFKIRYNLRAARCDIYALKSNNVCKIKKETWTELNDRVEDDIKEAIRRTFSQVKTRQQNGQDVPYLTPAVFGRDRWTECLNANLQHCEIDPFKEWIDGIEPRPSTRLNTWITELFNVSEESVWCREWVSRYLFLGIIQRTMRPGCKLDEFPVLIGQQGLGKSTVGSSILPPQFREEGHTDGLEFSDDLKKVAESLEGVIIAEAAEMVGVTRADIERLKTIITRQNDGRARMAYRRNKESKPRRCIFFGTSNDDQALPNDPTGNRRFVVCKLEGERAKQSVEKYFDEHRDELWAAAKAAYLNDAQANLPYEMKKQQTASNENYRRVDETMFNLVQKLNPDNYQDGATLAELTQSVSDGIDAAEKRMEDRAWQNRFGKELRVAGWNLKLKRRDKKPTRLWFPSIKA